MIMKKMCYSQLESRLAFRGEKRDTKATKDNKEGRQRQMPSGYAQIREAITALLTAATEFEYSARDFEHNRTRILAHISKALFELRQARDEFSAPPEFTVRESGEVVLAS